MQQKSTYLSVCILLLVVGQVMRTRPPERAFIARARSTTNSNIDTCPTHDLSRPLWDLSSVKKFLRLLPANLIRYLCFEFFVVSTVRGVLQSVS